MVKHKEIADRAGITLNDLDCLLRGSVTANVANRLGVSIDDVSQFLKGNGTVAMTKRLAFQAQTATSELAHTAGRTGAIGILIGLLFSTH
jgi:hypothetical protein